MCGIVIGTGYGERTQARASKEEDKKTKYTQDRYIKEKCSYEQVVVAGLCRRNLGMTLLANRLEMR
jgi:hypothetical protein